MKKPYALFCITIALLEALIFLWRNYFEIFAQKFIKNILKRRQLHNSSAQKDRNSEKYAKHCRSVPNNNFLVTDSNYKHHKSYDNQIDPQTVLLQ